MKGVRRVTTDRRIEGKQHQIPHGRAMGRIVDSKVITVALPRLARHHLACKAVQIGKPDRPQQCHQGTEDLEPKGLGNKNTASSKMNMAIVPQDDGLRHAGRAVHLARLILQGTEGRELIGHRQDMMEDAKSQKRTKNQLDMLEVLCHHSSYDQQPSQYGSSPAPGYGPAVTSNTSRTRQSSYQQVEPYAQPSPYVQQPTDAQRQPFEPQQSYAQQPAVQQRPYGEEPYEQQFQGRPSYGRQTSPRQPQTYVERYSYEQLPPGQRPDEEEPEAQQYSGRQQSYGQQSPFGQTTSYAQAPPYGQQVAYSEYPPYAPYYGSSSAAQAVTPASYRTEIDSQELSARMGNVRLDDDPYRQSNPDERYEYEEDQEAVAEEAQATSSRIRAHKRRSGR
ncbi:uncharacterized protein FTOL_08188 [Fusarium torulosum]|uniref:Uncharacterized protein n=1 Tax=Fusarium torulosum TaxID=33205 RepID=A0AAE8MDM8_9HYPO|nr:uncharacterized protein FTOL_08188 [Fusarium torulosum]